MKPDKLKNKKAVLLYEGRHIRLLCKGSWEYVQRTNCTGIVIIVAMTDEGKVILTHQFRPPVGTNIIEFPAGLVNDQEMARKETVIAAARRELLEETGYVAKEVFKLVEGPAGGGLSSDILTFVMARGLRKVAEGGGDETEAIVIHEVPFLKVKPWLGMMKRKGYLADPKIYAGLYFLAQYNKILDRKFSFRSHRS